jgi:putative cell wall-binding protein
LATGENFPDALAGGAGAAQARLPLLLTRRDLLPDVTAEVLRDLGIQRVIVLGGSAAVSDAVLTRLRDSGVLVERIAGSDRAETAANFARLLLQARADGGFGFEQFAPAPGCGPGRAAIVVDGRGFADALSSGPFAARCMAPILLSSSSATTGFLQTHRNAITRVVGVGGQVIFV